MKKIKTNIITGSLGAGKTTIILNLIKQIGDKEKVLWLKNEFGDINIDSKLVENSAIQTKEILNGCLCCVLIGKLTSALEEIVANYEIDRLIIETAGTAHPYPIVNEVNNISGLDLDSVIKVVDCLNFDKFDDKSYLARQQSELFDLVILNKTKLISKDDLEKVEDEVFDLYLEVPKFMSQDGFVPKDLLTGYNSKFRNFEDFDKHDNHHSDEIEAFAFDNNNNEFDLVKLKLLLEKLNSQKFYRIKGLVRNDNKTYLLNYVLGQIKIEEIEVKTKDNIITFIGEDILEKEDWVIDELKKLII